MSRQRYKSEKRKAEAPRLDGESRVVRELEKDPASSIEQHLDMMETGPLRGDDILRRAGGGRTARYDRPDRDPVPLPDEYGMQHNYRLDMSEGSREGDEMTGDEHSFGLQGGDPDLARQPTVDNGLPGEETEREERREGRDPSAA